MQKQHALEEERSDLLVAQASKARSLQAEDLDHSMQLRSSTSKLSSQDMEGMAALWGSVDWQDKA
eukprot:12315491-Alexandrium_andersonii.AAC.1